MATSAPPPQSTCESVVLTKPTEWSQYMVDASLKATLGEKLPLKFPTHDDAKIEILNTLNWYEAHSEYSWPDFLHLGFDFPQTMRLRRALVHDVFVALQKNGSVKVSPEVTLLGTPNSTATQRGVKRASSDSKRIGKRSCRRDPSDDTDDATSIASDIPLWYDKHFLAEAMLDLIDRTEADVESYLKGEKSPNALADIVHDGLVRVWDRPQAEYGVVPNVLERMKVAWEAERNRSA